MSSKRFNKLPKETKKLKSELFEKLIHKEKKNRTKKLNEAIDLSFQINKKQKKK